MNTRKLIKAVGIFIAVAIILDFLYTAIFAVFLHKTGSNMVSSDQPKEIDFVIINQMPVTIDRITISSKAKTDAVTAVRIPVGDTARLLLTIADTSEGTYLVNVFTPLKNTNHQLGYYTKAFTFEDVIIIVKDSADAELIYPDN